MSDAAFRPLSVSASGLYAERRRLDIIAQNIANAQTTRTPDGGPYRRQMVVFETELEKAARAGEPDVAGVRVSGVEDDRAPFERIYRPGHPDADDQGYVLMPNVSLPMEMVDLISAQRGYDANLRAARAYKQMADRSFDLLR